MGSTCDKYFTALVNNYVYNMRIHKCNQFAKALHKIISQRGQTYKVKKKLDTEYYLTIRI